MDDSLTILRNIWKTTLDIENIEENDHFFILGGDSLLASIVVLSISETLGSEITLFDLYENPTFIDFADVVNKRRVSSSRTILLVTA